MTSTIKVNNIQNQCGQNIINENSNTITIGASGDTIALASGASQTGFGRSGSVNWQTTPKTTTFTAADGEGYFINSGSALTMNLPAGSAGAIVAVSDYARNFATYNFTISPNGSEKIGGEAKDAILDIDGQAATFVYVDSTKGWINVQNAEDTETGKPPFIEATGGTITTCGNCKVHTFTGPGTFTVTTAACCAADNEVSYLVVAGGGGGGSGTDNSGGGGGAGGFRESKSPITPYTASPLDGRPSAPNRITVTATGFPITVGGGGNGSSFPSGAATVGSNSVFSTITSAGGGIGGNQNSPQRAGGNGGSGGGGGGGGYGQGTAGSGNTPPTTPPQGQNGGTNSPGPGPAPDASGGGGGGAGAAGGSVSPSNGGGGPGGAGVTTGINFSNTAFAGGGGGGTYAPSRPTRAAGGTGGGGGGGRAPASDAEDGTANTGGGGGGNSSTNDNGDGGAGGSGIVIIRYRFQ